MKGKDSEIVQLTAQIQNMNQTINQLMSDNQKGNELVNLLKLNDETLITNKNIEIQNMIEKNQILQNKIQTKNSVFEKLNHEKLVLQKDFNQMNNTIQELTQILKDINRNLYNDDKTIFKFENDKMTLLYVTWLLGNTNIVGNDKFKFKSTSGEQDRQNVFVYLILKFHQLMTTDNDMRLFNRLFLPKLFDFETNMNKAKLSSPTEQSKSDINNFLDRYFPNIDKQKITSELTFILDIFFIAPVTDKRILAKVLENGGLFEVCLVNS